MSDPSAFVRAAVAGASVTLVIALGGCGTSDKAGTPGGDDSDGPDTSGDPSGEPGEGETPPAPQQFEIKLVADGASGSQRVNFAVPLPAAALDDVDNIRVLEGTTELPAARRGLSKYGDGSFRSVQLQVDVDVTASSSLTVVIGAPATGTLELVPVESTLTGTGNDVHPKVWAIVPAAVLTASTFAGPVIPRAEITGTTLDSWSTVCDYDRWDTDAFLASSASRDVWLFDRVTAMYRGYAITGELSPLRSAYREASIYQAGMTIVNGKTTGIIVPQEGSSDLKYHYSQGMALHYLLTGDDRFREAAEAISAKVVTMWDPDYNGTDEFWTERHAGFALLAHEWAALVSDDRSAEIEARADAAVTAFLAAQMAPRFGYTDPDARCFAHSATAHGEGYGTAGCSPWMSAILADGLDAHARRVGGARAEAVHAALGRLGRIVARDGLDATGRPLYWLGLGASADERDDFDEHWGESAYVVALAWNVTGKTETALRDTAERLMTGLRDHGEVPHPRSFNWQCRSAVMTPALLR